MLKDLPQNEESKYEDFRPLYGPGDVPGYLSAEDLDAIEYISNLVPGSGILVEVGSFLGKSAVEWSKNFSRLYKDYTIICIDSFNSPVGVLNRLLQEADFVAPTGVSNNLEMFKHYTKNYKNIFPVTGFFDEKFLFPTMVDVVFEDSDYTMKHLTHSLPFWWKHINKGGIFVGHNYGGEVQTAVDIFVALNKLEVKTFKTGTNIYYIEKP